MTLRTPVPAIDIHTHLFPPRLSLAVRNALSRMYDWTFTLPDDPVKFAALEHSHGIERFCMLPYAHKAGMSRSLNEWMAATARTISGAIGFACVHPDDEDPAAILADAFDLGLRGVKLHFQVQETAPSDPRWEPVYRFMLERDAPLIVHAGRGPTDNGLVGAAEFTKLMEWFPGLRICVAHMGAPEQPEFLSMLGRYEKLFLDTSGRSALDGVDETNASRILYGSDAPNIPHTIDDGIARVLALPADLHEPIFRGNAVRFLTL